MRKLIYLISLFYPLLLFPQVQHIAFNAEGLKLQYNVQYPSADLSKLLALPAGFSFVIQDKKTQTDKDGTTHYTYQEYYQQYPVENVNIKLHVRNGTISYINGDYVSEAPADIRTTLTESDALNYAKQHIGAKKYIWDDAEELRYENSLAPDNLLYPAPHSQQVIYVDAVAKDAHPHLTYKFDIYAKEPLSRNYVYVNSATGQVEGKESRIHTVDGYSVTRYSGPQWICTKASSGQYILQEETSCGRGGGVITKNMNSGGSYSAATDFTDNDNTWTSAEHHNAAKDDAAEDAHWGAEMTYDFFNAYFGRNSIDNAGLALQNYVHADLPSIAWYFFDNNNAFWDGTKMTYGDGDGTHVGPLVALDVVGHEISHGLCQYTANLSGGGESGALNEGLSDIWGTCIKHWAAPAKTEWIIGTDMMLAGTISGFNRSLQNPKSLGQPDTYLGTNWSSSGEPHTNNGPCIHWFYLLTAGGAGTNDNSNTYSVTGIGIEDAAAVVYRAETVYMTSFNTYADMRTYTVQAAKDLFGSCDPRVKSVEDAWYAVGVGNSFATQNTLNITSAVAAGSTLSYNAAYITSTSLVSGTNTHLTYVGGMAVTLNPGFYAMSGTVTLAYIGSCSIAAKTDGDGTVSRDPADDNAPGTMGFSSTPAVAIYPNPSNGMITVQVPYAEEPSSITITDLSGRMVRQISTTETANQLDIQSLTPGTYIISVSNPLISHVEKITKL